MRFTAVFLSGLLLCMLSAYAPGQTPLLCDAAEPQDRFASGEILESRLPLVRASLEGPGDVWVGQGVSLNLEVIVQTWFADSPTFPDIEIENALVLSTGDAVNAVVRSGGKTFSGQDRQYLVFPQTAGDYTIPPVKVSVSYALPGGKASVPTAYASSPLTFTARMPPRSEGAKYFLTADRFEIRQSFDRKPDGLKVGDAIVRSVRMTAENTASMMLPALAFEAPDGIRCYRGEPKNSDQAERGAIEAARTETATYVPTRAGKYRIPEIAVEWWAPRQQKMNTARLAPLDFTVEETPGRTAEVLFKQRGQVPGYAGHDRPDRFRAPLCLGLWPFRALFFFFPYPGVSGPPKAPVSGNESQKRRRKRRKLKSLSSSGFEEPPFQTMSEPACGN